MDDRLTTPPSGYAVVLFDGECNLCSRSVRFVIARDPKGQFRFAPLQSEMARLLLQSRGMSAERFDTVVLAERDRISTRSTAALRIARKLRFPWPLAYYALIWIPRPLRDVAYDFVARRRYRWFGRSQACAVPAPDLASRLVADSWLG